MQMFASFGFFAAAHRLDHFLSEVATAKSYSTPLTYQRYLPPPANGLSRPATAHHRPLLLHWQGYYYPFARFFLLRLLVSAP